MPVRTCLRPSSRIQYCSRYHRHVLCVLIYHLIASSVHHDHQSRHKPSIFHSRFPSHLYILPCTQRWQGSSPVPRSRQKRDGTFSSLAGGHQNGRFNPFTRRRTDTALTRAQPILLGGLEQGLSPGPIYHLIPDELSLLTSISKQIHMSEEGDPARGL